MVYPKARGDIAQTTLNYLRIPLILSISSTKERTDPYFSLAIVLAAD
jgi:hypothetical protein